MLAIEHREVEDGIVRITRDDGNRFYSTPNGDYYSSVTTILQSLPPSPHFIKWLKENGSDSDKIRDEAAARGTVIHQAIERINNNEEVRVDTRFKIKDGYERTLTFDEIHAVLGYLKAREELGIVPVANEMQVFCSEHKYAGTLDMLAYVGDDLYIIDIKTGALSPSATLQLSAYQYALENDYPEIIPPEHRGNIKLAVLQVGSKLRTKKNWRLTKLEYDMESFLDVKKMHDKYHADELPKTLEVNEVIYAPVNS
jgi:hypothetical protein